MGKTWGNWFRQYFALTGYCYDEWNRKGRILGKMDTWKGRKGVMECEIVLTWLVVDGSLLWGWNGMLKNCKYVVRGSSWYESLRIWFPLGCHLRSWQVENFVVLCISVDWWSTQLLQKHNHTSPFVWRFQSCIASQQIIEEIIRNEWRENWCTMNKEVIDADCELLFVKPFRITWLSVISLCETEWVENGEDERVGGKSYCDSNWRIWCVDRSLNGSRE